MTNQPAQGGGGGSSPARRRSVRDSMTQQQAAAQAAEADKPADAGGKPGKEVATRDPARDFLERMRDEIVQALPGQITADRFIRVCLTGLKSSPQARSLVACRRSTLQAAILQAAYFGLMPFTDEAAIVPYGDEAKFLPMYQGFIQMCFRTNQVQAVTAKLIYKRDEWGEAYGDGGGFYHKPVRFDQDGRLIPRGDETDNPPILAYCYVTLKGGGRTEVEIVDRARAEYVRDTYSRSYARAEQNGKRNSTWHTEFPSMWLKTAVRADMKWAPKSPELVELLVADVQADARTRAEVLSVFPGGRTPGAAWEGDVEFGTIVDGDVVGDDPWDAEPAAEADNDRAGTVREQGLRFLSNVISAAGLAAADQAADRHDLMRALLGDPGYDPAASATDEQVDTATAALTKLVGQRPHNDPGVAKDIRAEITRYRQQPTASGRKAG